MRDPLIHRRLIFAVLALLATALAGASAAGQAEQERSSLNEKLVIIAPQALRHAIGEFLTFKKRRMFTTFFSLEHVQQTSVGDDDAEKLKRFLYTQWRMNDFGYVLLVGDVDTIPVRYMALDRITPAAFDYAFYATDLYYADLAKPDRTFDDWNAQHDGFHARYIGEVRGEKNKTDPVNFDEVDYQPEIAVGRWPVNTPEEVLIVAQKSMAYERGVEALMVMGPPALEHPPEKPGARVAALINCEGWVDGRGMLDAVAAELPALWIAQRRYFADATRNDNTPPPTKEQVIALLNAGAGIVAHIGHGDNNSWNGCLSVNDLTSLNNADRLPIMISAGCSTAVCTAQAPYEAYIDADGMEHAGTNNGEVFTAPPPPPACYQKGPHNATSMGEQLLRHNGNGAAAYIGCNTGGQPCALTLVEGFINAIGRQSKPRLGNCWVEAVMHYCKKENLATIKPDEGWYPPSVFYQPMKFMVFGDPTLPIAGPKAGANTP